MLSVPTSEGETLETSKTLQPLPIPEWKGEHIVSICPKANGIGQGICCYSMHNQSHIYYVIEVFFHVSTKNKRLFSTNWMKSLEHKRPYKGIIYSDI